jgi:hypothetical protein
MREHYDFSKAKRNPYARRLKQQVTIRLDHDTVKYFKRLAEETGIGGLAQTPDLWGLRFLEGTKKAVTSDE